MAIKFFACFFPTISTFGCFWSQWPTSLAVTSGCPTMRCGRLPSRSDVNMIKCSFDIGVDATPFAHTTFGAGIFTHISQQKQRILTGPVGQFLVPTEFFSHNDGSRGPLISMTVPFYRTGVVVFGCKKSSEGKSTSSRTFGSTHRAVRSRRPSAIASVGPLIDLETPKLAPKINPNRWFL